jgi:hypothetical protein
MAAKAVITGTVPFWHGAMLVTGFLASILSLLNLGGRLPEFVRWLL